MNSILITTLGEPAGWDVVEYVYGDKSFTGKCTLPLLVNHEAIKPDATIVIVLDTAINRTMLSYDDLIEGVLSKYRDFVREMGLEVNSMKFIVAPGVGRFQSMEKTFFNFVGELSDYHAYIVYSLSKVLSKVGPGANIHLDITHGINFMPSMTLLAVKELASVLAVVLNDIKLNLYNAEPYRKNITNRLNVHKVEDSVAIEYDLTPIGAKGKCDLLKHFKKDVHCKEMSKGELKELTSRCERLKGEINAFLSSVFNGLPLALYTFYPNVGELENIINRVVEIWRENIRLTSKGGEVFICRGLSFGRDFIKLIKAWLIAKTLNLGRKREVTCEEIIHVKEEFFSRFSRKIDEMISRDVYELRKRAKGREEQLRDWTKLRDVFKEPEQIAPRDKKFAPRDFLAHSGLEMNVTEVKYDGRSLVLRYAESEMANVLNGCASGLVKVV